MSRSTYLIAGLFGSFAVSCFALVLAPQAQLGGLEPRFTEEDGRISDIYPVNQSGIAEQGRRIYAREGCVYCHTQQVRDPQVGLDIIRGWGERRSVARDYLYDSPPFLGSTRLGPDLSNVGSATWRNEAKDTTTPPKRDAAWHLRHFVELREGAMLHLVEHELAAGEHAHLGNALLHAHVADGASLSHVRVQDAAPRATLFARTDAVLAREARYARTDLELGAALSRHELNVRLEGKAAALRADGVLLADGRRHVDTRLGIDHIARDTTCDLTWRGLAGQRGKAVFHGGITIAAGADGSEADLSNKNLLLSADAEIDTQPVLEIHADEVKAAHGATVG